MTTTTSTLETSSLPAPGTWEIDPSHSSVAFSVRHLGLAKVRGRFNAFSGTLVVAEPPTDSSVSATIDATSVDTRDAKRDEHLRSPDFFDAAAHPTLDFRSTRVTGSGAAWKVEGELSMHGTTKPVVLDVSFEGAAQDPWGGSRIAFSASTEVDREQWGLTWNQALEAGGWVVGKKIRIDLEVEAVRAAA